VSSDVEVSGVGRRDDDQVDRGIDEHGIEITHDPCLRVGFAGLVAMSLHDVRQSQERVGMDQGSVEHSCSHPETDESDIDGRRHSGYSKRNHFRSRSVTFVVGGL